MRWFLTSDIGKYLYILAITRCKLLLQLFLCYSSPAFNTTASLLKCIGTKAVFLKIFIFVVLTRSGDSSWINQGFIWFVSYSALISVRKSSWFLQNSPKSQNWQCMWAFIVRFLANVAVFNSGRTWKTSRSWCLRQHCTLLRWISPQSMAKSWTISPVFASGEFDRWCRWVVTYLTPTKRDREPLKKAVYINR